MKRLTAEEKLEAIIEHLTDVIDGGYPGDYVWIGNTMAYTTANTGEKYGSRLGTITRRDMLAWYDRAADFLKEHEDESDWSDALYETAKEQGVP